MEEGLRPDLPPAALDPAVISIGTFGGCVALPHVQPRAGLSTPTSRFHLLGVLVTRPLFFRALRKTEAAESLAKQRSEHWARTFCTGN